MPHDEFDAVVIGAGAAGLAAARRLAAGGVSLMVLEARERPGGRAWTSPLANGEQVDLGCEWLHSAESNPFVAIAEAQGAMSTARRRPGAASPRRSGRIRGAGPASPRRWARFRERVDNRPPDAPDVACDTLLDPQEPFNPLIDAISTYYSGAELAKVSAADLAAYDDGAVNWRVREGYGAVIAALAEGLPVRYGCPVRAIDRRGPRLRVETATGALSARAVVVTLPSDVLAQTPDFFRPALAEKTEAAAGLPLGLADKVYLELLTPQDFPSDSRAFGDMGRRDTGAYHFRPLGRPIVEGFFGGELAESMERSGEGGAFDFAERGARRPVRLRLPPRDQTAALLRLARRPLRARRLFLRAARPHRQPRRARGAGRGPAILRRRSLLGAELLDRARRLCDRARRRRGGARRAQRPLSRGAAPGPGARALEPASTRAIANR